jgi:nitroreductase
MDSRPDLFTTLETWTTARRFRPEPVSGALIGQLLELAVHAPTCRLAQPWRFHIIGEHTRLALGELGRVVMGECGSEKAGIGSQHMLLSAPSLVAVSVRYSQANNPRRVDEDYAAVCCCIQNLNLVAHAHGLSLWWRTGALVRHQQTHTLLGLGNDEQLVGIITIGYPEQGVYANLKPASSHTRWLP